VLTNFLRVAARRWYILLAGVLATLALVYAIPKVISPSYTANGLVLLVPSEGATGTGGNPLLGLDGLNTPAAVIVAYFKSEAAAEDVAKVSPHAKYTVQIEPSTKGPLIQIEVKDPTAAGALKTMHEIADTIPATLAKVQSNVGSTPRFDIQSQPLTLDAEATKSTKAAKRLQVDDLAGPQDRSSGRQAR
jgi:hypothetical protein